MPKLPAPTEYWTTLGNDCNYLLIRLQLSVFFLGADKIYGAGKSGTTGFINRSQGIEFYISSGPLTNELSPRTDWSVHEWT